MAEDHESRYAHVVGVPSDDDDKRRHKMYKIWWFGEAKGYSRSLKIASWDRVCYLQARI